jgi:hypothetical protein
MCACELCRWAGETEPRVIFRNIVQRPRHKATGTRVFLFFFFFFFWFFRFCLAPGKVAEKKGKFELLFMFSFIYLF